MDRQINKPPVASIPRQWRETVRDILHRGCAKDIIPTKWAQDEWAMAFPESYVGDLYSALEATLADDGLLGRAVPGLEPPGEAYEFFFSFQGKRMYGKLNLLLPQRKVVVIVSAHPPYKGNEL